MKKSLAVTAIATTALIGTALAIPGSAAAQGMGDDVRFAGPQAGDWEVTLSGSGTSDKDFDTNALGIQGSVGKYMLPNVLVGVRQSLSWAESSNDEDTVSGATRAFADYVFDLGRWRPYIGASLGGIYGENVNDSFFAGPEAGLKYYADNNTFIYAQTEYQFTFQDSDDVDEAFDDGGWAHAIGIGFNF